jgi:mRNA interferase MazF
MKYTIIERGDVYFADLDGKGCEQQGLRPIVIIQNNTGNKYSNTVIVAPVTGREKRTDMPVHVLLPSDILPSVSVVLADQIQTIDKKRLKNYVTTLPFNIMERVTKALEKSIMTY